MESNDSDEKNSSSLGYKLVPWVNWDEWNYVRKSIFSSSPNLISAALQKISAWESRGCLPIAIDLTAVIIEIHQKDPFFRGDDSIGDALASEKMLNMLYCMFIMRLVNDFVEPAHKETGRSISDLADAVGIPRTLVDIRHESSHRCLPSLKLARSASAKALEWLRDNYWEPQRIAVHDSRRKVKSRLLEMISCLTSHRVSRAKSAKPKRKCGKRTTLLAACHKFSHTNKMLLASKSDASTVQIFKVTKRAAHLYSLYPSLVVSSLLEIFLSHASDISADIDMECSDDSERSISEPVACSLTDLKMVITKLSNKKPRLLLDMLKTVLEMIEEKDSWNFENDWNHFLSSQNQFVINQVFHLRSLFPFLIRNLKTLKESGQIVLVEDNQVLSKDNIAVPKILLSNLLHKCLTLLVPGDKHLLKSVLLLSEMCGNRSLTEKLPLLAYQSEDLDSLATLSYNESMLLKVDDSIEKAEERLNHLKLRILNDKNIYTRHMNSNSDATTRRWTITKAWVACPIGMLPCSFSSTAVLPSLDVMKVERETNKYETTRRNIENVCAADENEMVCDDNEFFEDGNPVKILKQTPQDEGSLALENPFPMQGRLLIGGVWKNKFCVASNYEMRCMWISISKDTLPVYADSYISILIAIRLVISALSDFIETSPQNCMYEWKTSHILSCW